MSEKFAVTILVDPVEKTITVYDNMGNERPLKSVIVCGGGFEEGAFYQFAWGGSSDLGWALGESFRWARLQRNYEEAKFYRRAWDHALKWICTFLGIRSLQEISPEDIVEKWGKEDLERAAKEASEKKSWN
jgi:hypothetical protein